MSKDLPKDQPQITIKKYANRRLYNTETSTYVTLDDLAELVREERDFVVCDAKTGEDLTHSVLTQIILEQESRGQNLLPVNFLRQLIRFYGDNVGLLVPSYLEMSIDSLASQQEKYRKQFTDTFSSTALEAIQEQTRQNIAMFEKAMEMFSPFAAAARDGEAAAANGASDLSGDAGEGGGESEGDEGGETPAGTSSAGDELATLKDQLVAMQDQINRLSKSIR